MCSNHSAGPSAGLLSLFSSYIVLPASCLAAPTLAVAASGAGSVYEALWFCHPGREQLQIAASVPLVPHTSIIPYLQLLCLAQLCGRLDSSFYGNSARFPG